MSFLPFNRTYRHIRRYQQIIRILMKYGFDDILAQLRLDYYLPLRRKVLPGTRQKERLEEFVTRPQRIRKAFEELGPTFIKLGQLLSVRPDLIPADYATEFSKLLDEVPTFSSQQARKIIEHELRKPVESCFKSFDSEPISAASIAQVHHAISEAGDLVVVKIQRPNIEKTIEEDILILYDLAYLAEKYLAESQIVDPVGIVDEFAQTIRREIDFIREGHNIERFGKNFSDDPTMYVPTVYWEFSTRRVLTMERIEGIKLNQLDPAQFTEEERKEIAVRGANSILREIFEHGFFHADPHPANIFLLDGLVIAPVDFGIMGTIDEQTKDRLSSLLRGVVDKDVNKIIRSFYNLGYLDYNFDTKGLQREIYEYIDRYHGLPLEQIDPTQNIPELFEIFRRYRMRLRPELAFMGKALIIQNSIGRWLYPEFDIFGLAKPYVRKLIMRRYRPKKQMEDVLNLYEDSIDFFKSLPFDMKIILERIKRGDTTIRMEHKGLKQLIQEMDRSSNRITFGLIIAALVIGSSIVMHLDKGPFVMGFSLLGISGYLIAGILGLWLVIAILRSGRL